MEHTIAPPNYSTVASISGFLCIDKPAGITSNQVLNQLKQKIGIKKMGHTGTLDPFATGLLVVGLNEALKFIPYLQEEPKVYQATLKLGIQTDTMDCDGEVVAEKPIPKLNQTQIETIFKKLLGKQTQIPPMFSAKKIQGKKLYELARAGQEVKRDPVPIEIFSLELLNFSEHEIQFEVGCSKGSYVRVLGETIAQQLGTLGHLIALRRLQAGHFTVQTKLASFVLTDELVAIPQALAHLPEIQITLAQVKRLGFGQKLNWETTSQESLVRLQVEHQFYGLGLLKDGLLIPHRLMS